MEEKSQLNDIILNKGGNSTGSKKVLLAIATLAIVLIIVVVIMNRISADSNEHLPQAVLPPEPVDTPALVEDDPLFEPVLVIEEEPAESDNLDKIAQKLKEESLTEIEDVVEAINWASTTANAFFVSVNRFSEGTPSASPDSRRTSSFMSTIPVTVTRSLKSGSTPLTHFERPQPPAPTSSARFMFELLCCGYGVNHRSLCE